MRGPKRDEPVGRGRTPPVLILNDGGERRRRAGAPEGDAGAAHHRGGVALLVEARAEEALQLQRPLPDEMMAEVARGERRDDI